MHIWEPGPSNEQEACSLHPPLLTEQGSERSHHKPSPMNPLEHTQDTVLGPVGVHTASGSQPPLLTLHGSAIHMAPSRK